MRVTPRSWGQRDEVEVEEAPWKEIMAAAEGAERAHPRCSKRLLRAVEEEEDVGVEVSGEVNAGKEGVEEEGGLRYNMHAIEFYCVFYYPPDVSLFRTAATKIGMGLDTTNSNCDNDNPEEEGEVAESSSSSSSDLTLLLRASAWCPSAARTTARCA